uniref:Pancreatic trypsin inhibitor n=1 Tax=Rhipicephalus appendiculatus TaxID=34631 RepID=A0A131YTV6_RHIAP
MEMFLLLLVTFLITGCFCVLEKEKDGYGCYEERHEVGCGTAFPEKWFYNSSSKRCMAQTSGGCIAGTKYFSNISDCNRYCRDRIYGVCTRRRYRRMCRYIVRKLKVQFNPRQGICEWYVPHCPNEENSFNDMNECYDKCGEFVTNPCVLPIKAIAKGSTYHQGIQFRYGYDQNTKKCVRFQLPSSNGNINSFKTRKECLETCAPKSPCLFVTEHHTWRPFTSYFYDFNHDSCNITRTFFWKSDYWPRANRFYSYASCHEQCMPDLYSFF